MGNLNRRQRERARQQRKAERRAQRPNPSAEKSAAGVSTEPKRGTAPVVIDPSRRWHIARLLPRMGERTIKDLAKAEVTVFQPRTSEVVVRMRRRVVRSAQLLPRTVFIGVRDEAHLDTARSTQGLAEIVSRPEEEGGPEGNITGLVLRPARLDPVVLQRFADAVAEGEIVAAVGIAVGQSVLVLDGPFASFPAIVEAVLPSDKVKVGVSLFGRSVPLVLDLAQVATR